MNEIKLDKLSGLFDIETVIESVVDGLFPEDMIFSEYDMHHLDNEVFFNMEEGEEKCACIILYAGFSPSTSNKKAVKTKHLWRVIVVTPSEFYKTLAGKKLLEVIKAVHGFEPFTHCGDPFKLETDVREFNEPAFVNNLVGLPALFSVELTIDTKR